MAVLAPMPRAMVTIAARAEAQGIGRGRGGRSERSCIWVGAIDYNEYFDFCPARVWFRCARSTRFLTVAAHGEHPTPLRSRLGTPRVENRAHPNAGAPQSVTPQKHRKSLCMALAHPPIASRTESVDYSRNGTASPTSLTTVCPHTQQALAHRQPEGQYVTVSRV